MMKKLYKMTFLAKLDALRQAEEAQGFYTPQLNGRLSLFINHADALAELVRAANEIRERHTEHWGANDGCAVCKALDALDREQK